MIGLSGFMKSTTLKMSDNLGRQAEGGLGRSWDHVTIHVT